MKVIAWYITEIIITKEGTEKKEEVKVFDTLEEASAFFGVSEKRILSCIKTGRNWKGVTYDEAL